jgi:hypothetical protein
MIEGGYERNHIALLGNKVRRITVPPLQGPL